MMLKDIIKKIGDNIWILRSIHKTVYFNFRYLPLRQAVKLPILLYKPHFHHLNGYIEIRSQNIKRGMIILGKYGACIYPNNGITLDIRGTIIFEGDCFIGNDSYLSISEQGVLHCGDKFLVTSALKLICYENIKIGNDVLVGWECMICDNDFHTIIDKTNNSTARNKGCIRIGNKVWIANNCNIMKNATIPSNIVIASHSLVSKRLDIPCFSLVAGTPATLKKTNIDWTF